jgi:hypothetical protein
MWHAHLARDLRAGRPCHVAKIHQNLMAVIECWIKSLSASSAKTSDSSLRLIAETIELTAENTEDSTEDRRENRN